MHSTLGSRASRALMLTAFRDATPSAPPDRSRRLRLSWHPAMSMTFQRVCCASLAAMILSSAAATAQPRLQPQDFFRLRAVGDVQVSRDGARVATASPATTLPAARTRSCGSWTSRPDADPRRRRHRPRQRAGLVAGLDSRGLQRPHRRTVRPRRHSRGRLGPGSPRSDAGHQQQRAPQRRRRHRLVAGRPADRVRERHPGSRGRRGGRRPDGHHAISLQTDGVGRQHALQRQAGGCTSSSSIWRANRSRRETVPVIRGQSARHRGQSPPQDLVVREAQRAT